MLLAKPVEQLMVMTWWTMKTQIAWKTNENCIIVQNNFFYKIQNLLPSKEDQFGVKTYEPFWIFCRGEFRIFSRRWNFKSFSKILPTFFQVDQIDFRALPEHHKDPLKKLLAPQANFWKKKQVKNAVFGQQFLEARALLYN